MPTYDYKCLKCEHVFETFQSMNDDRLTDCPQEGCDGALKRLLGTGAGIIFKGSGFYETDYRSDSYKKAASADSKASESSSKPEKKDSSKSSDSGSSTKSSSSSSTAKPAKSDS